MPLATDQNTNGWWIEEAFVEAIKANTSAEFVEHYHSDETETGWPLVSVKATIQQEDPARIKVDGEPCEIYSLVIATEVPISEQEGGVRVSAQVLDRLARQLRLVVPLVAETQAIEMFDYFEVEPASEGEKDIEQNEEETPTRRVDVMSFEVIVIRG